MNVRSKFVFAAFFLVLGVFLARLPQTIVATRTWVAAMGGYANTSDADVNWRAAFEDVVEIVRREYVEPVSDEQLYKGAIAGLTESLNDPYTEFIAPSDRGAFEKDLTGQFVGIGASVNVRNGWLTIAYPLEQSPAYRAGLRPGDQVRAIDGTSTEGKSADDCVKILVGQPGTKVRLTIVREETPEPFDVTITRAPIAARAVKGFRYDSLKEEWDYRIDATSGIAYVRIDQFTPGVADEFRNALAASGVTRDCRGLIIDLRDNPGGLMDQAIEIVDTFLNSGTIVSTKGRDAGGEIFSARRGAVGDLPVAILLNQGSASASEIVAGALADNGRATVVGTRSYGKGLVQRVEPLAHVPGAQLKITEQHYYLPSGRMIHRTDDAPVWGVDPSPGFYVALTDEQQRRVWEVKRAMETIRPPVITADDRLIPAAPPAAERALADLITGDEARWSDPGWIATSLADPQLAAAVKAVQLRVADGKWTPTGSPEPDLKQSIASAELLRLERERERAGRFLDRLDERIAAVAGGKVPPRNAPPADLWPDATDLTGGRLEVFDKNGKLIARLDITGPDVERWLFDADVRASDAAKN
ncbi:MAG: S41 family peptidase [Phycisphaerales bacterium]